MCLNVHCDLQQLLDFQFVGGYIPSWLTCRDDSTSRLAFCVQALEFLQTFQQDQQDDLSLMITENDHFFDANTGM